MRSLLRRIGSQPTMSPIIPTAARRLLSDSQRLFVVTGAGMSADSGIPTFRGSSGLFGDKGAAAAPVHVEDLVERPQMVFDFHAEIRRLSTKATPHEGYTALASAQRSRRESGGDLTVVTMNVDNLHERAGIDVLQLHGSAFVERCSLDGCATGITPARSPQVCEVCGNTTRPDVVLYGEREALEANHFGKRALQRADAMLMVGVSGQTQRVNRWAIDARRDYQIPTVLWTLDPDPEFSELFTYVIDGPASALSEVLDT